MLKIRRLRLTLPAGFTGNPQQVARQVAEELARQPLPASSEPPERIERQVAQAATGAVIQTLGQTLGHPLGRRR